MVLCNRFRGTLDDWDPLFLNLLAEHYTVVTFDYSGIGLSTLPHATDSLSEVKDVRDLTQALDIRQCVLVGWSHGGRVAQYITAHTPQLVSHLILLGTGPLGKSAFGPEQIFFERALKPANDADDEVVLFFERRYPASVEAARARHPDPVLAAVTLEDVVTSYARIIWSLAEKPILVGHSFGGAISQVLMNQGLAAAVVSIHGAPPKGVFPYELNFLRSTHKALGLFTSLNKTYMMSFEKWQFALTNGMSYEEQKSAYYAIAIPESKRAARGGLTDAAYVDFKKPHVPILFLAGTKDQIITAHLCERVYKRYKDKGSIREFKLKDRNHYILGLPTWRQDAAEVYDWIGKHA